MPRPGLDRALDRLGVLQLQPHIQPAGKMTHRMIERQPSPRTLLTKNPGLPGKLVEPDRTASGQGVLRRAEHGQLVGDPGLHDEFRLLAATFDQTQIKFVMCDLLHDVRGVVHAQLYPAFGVALHETPDQQGSQVVANGQRGADRE